MPLVHTVYGLWQRLGVGVPMRCCAGLGDFYANCNDVHLNAHPDELHRAVAYMATSLMPNWDAVPRRVCDERVFYVPLGCARPAKSTHVLRFNAAYAAFERLDDASYVTITPLMELVDAVAREAISWTLSMPIRPQTPHCSVCGMPWGVCALPTSSTPGQPDGLLALRPPVSFHSPFRPSKSTQNKLRETMRHLARHATARRQASAQKSSARLAVLSLQNHARARRSRTERRLRACAVLARARDRLVLRQVVQLLRAATRVAAFERAALGRAGRAAMARMRDCVAAHRRTVAATAILQPRRLRRFVFAWRLIPRTRPSVDRGVEFSARKRLAAALAKLAKYKRSSPRAVPEPVSRETTTLRVWRRQSAGGAARRARAQRVEAHHARPLMRAALWRLRTTAGMTTAGQLAMARLRLAPGLIRPGFGTLAIGLQMGLVHAIVVLGVFALASIIHSVAGTRNPDAAVGRLIERLTRPCLPADRCQNCRKSIMGKMTKRDFAVRCADCLTRYCSSECCAAHHDGFLEHFCLKINPDQEMIAMAQDQVLLILKSWLEVGVLASLRRTDCRLSYAPVLDIVTVYSRTIASQLGVAPPAPQISMHMAQNVGPFYKAALMFSYLLPVIHTKDKWQPVFVECVRQNLPDLADRRSLRIVLAACMAAGDHGMVALGKNQQLLAPNWAMSQPEAMARSDLVVPQRVRDIVDEARRLLFETAAPHVCGPALLDEPVHTLFAVAGGKQVTPLCMGVMLGDTRGGFGSLHAHLWRILRIEYDPFAKPTDIMAMCQIMMADPVRAPGGHGLIRRAHACALHHTHTELSLRPEPSLLRILAGDDADPLVYPDDHMARVFRSAKLQADLAADLMDRLPTIRYPGDLKLEQWLTHPELTPRAVFGVLRTALYATNRTSGQVAQIMAHVATRLPELPSPGVKLHLREAALTTFFIEIERSWPEIPGNALSVGSHLKRFACYLSCDWASLYRAAEAAEDEDLMEKIILDRA
jgi:hypothetical protein